MQYQIDNFKVNVENNINLETLISNKYRIKES